MNTSHEKWSAERGQKLARERSHRRVSIVSSAAVLVALSAAITAMVVAESFYAVLVPALLLIWVAAFTGSALPGEGGAYARAIACAATYRWTAADRKKIHGYWAREWLSTTPLLGFLLFFISHNEKTGGEHNHQPGIHEIEPLMVTDLPDLLRLASDRDYASAAFHRGVRRLALLVSPVPVFFAAVAAAATLTIFHAIALIVLTAVFVWLLARAYHGWTLPRYMSAYRYLSGWCAPDSGEVASAAELSARTTEAAK